MSEEEEKRKKQFAALKRYLEQEQARVDREMPGATDKEKTDAVAAKLSDSLAASREKNEIQSLTAVLRGKKLQRERNQSDRDYSGGGFYYEESETLALQDVRTPGLGNADRHLSFTWVGARRFECQGRDCPLETSVAGSAAPEGCMLDVKMPKADGIEVLRQDRRVLGCAQQTETRLLIIR